ncbi:MULTISPECIES: FtsK/SpoIIIE domain-containing protein [unclassified Streptomyces]|uniref:FtsK/SpoIIIE domain-containing protein n=1 Tax=unclassified Streptomyces TaxID=2593676 RepID=UPI00278C1ADF|nr:MULTISPECIES: FtsK/SpoIIIE domain-containing protein [unclassified Streptomyces]
MRLKLTVVDPYANASQDLVLDVDPEARIDTVAHELAARVRGGYGQGSLAGQPAPTLHIDSQPVNPAHTVASSPLRDGVVVSLDDPAGSLPGEQPGVIEVRVSGGPDAGAVYRLGIGRYDIGAGAGCQLRFQDPRLPERALTLYVVSAEDLRLSVHGGWLDGAAAGQPSDKLRVDDKPYEGQQLRVGSQVVVGDTLLDIAAYTPPDAALKWSDDGSALDYNRPPRLRAPERTTKFRLPAPPKEYEGRPLPWLMAASPLVMGVTMALVMGRTTYLLMAAFSPLIMIGNYFWDKKHGRKNHDKQVKEYEEHKARIERDAQEALVLERGDRGLDHPDPGTVWAHATGPRTRLWERRRSDADHLLLRVGTGRLPSAVVLDDPEQDDHRRQVTWEIADTPVTLHLGKLGVIGFAGPEESARSMACWAVTQAAALHSPLDVQFYVFTESHTRDSWGWLRWLPHAKPTAQDANVLIGNDAETVGARIGELTQILEARQKAAKDNKGQAGFADPDIVVVWDGSRRLRSMPGVVRLLAEGPAVSMYAICLDAEERFLPGECKGIVIAEPRDARHVRHEKQVGGGANNAVEVLRQAAEDEQRKRAAAEGGGGRRKKKGKQQAVGASSPELTNTAAVMLSLENQGGVPSPATPTAAEQVDPRVLRLRVQQAGESKILGVRPDFVSPAWCERVARSLAPLRDISGEATDSALPDAARLLDVMQMEPPTAQAVVGRWQSGGQSTLAMVGESYDGPFGIDIRKDGPHGLIAGTTGSGKSELLQTIVAALAVANTPQNMTFVLVDYKGGSAFKDCVHLPHTVGMVTDLDAHLVERALESLGAELHRREHMLAQAGAKDIEDYQDLVRRNPQTMAPLPRLLLVIDEFASMVRDLPDFVTGLVNIAQRGRSLGIHLMLATQRPSGVVSPEIRANTNLRIALRVTDGGESSDVIDSPEAGNISKNNPGRAYVRTGAASLIPFQSGRVGGRRPGTVDPATLAPWAGELDWTSLGRGALAKPAAAKGEEEEITDLKVLVDAIREANGYLGIPQQHSPWLPALTETVLPQDLPQVRPLGPLPAAVYGIEDLPASQSRRPVAVDFATFGHLLIAGAPRSGRSQTLRTIAGSLAMNLSTCDVHMYGIDCGNGALNALSKLPHCGAVVGRNQSERAIRLIRRLSSEVTRRQELLAQDGYADIGEQRAAVRQIHRLPHIVLFLDRWEGWVTSLGELEHGELTDELLTLMREGASVGVHLIITGDRQLLTGRIASLTEDKVALRLADRTDFSMLGINSRKVPDDIPPGRAFRNETGREIQFALLNEDASGQGQSAALAAIGDMATPRDANVPKTLRPFRVDSLPSRISFDQAWQHVDGQAAASPLWGLVGVGGDDLTAFGPDLAYGLPGFVVAGPAKSGRSTVLMNMARTYLGRGTRVVVCAPRMSPLRELAGMQGVLAMFTGNDIDEDELQEAVSTASRENPVAILVDDAEALEDCDAEDEFKRLIASGADRGIGIVVAGDEDDVCSGFSGWQVDLKKSRRGLLLSPQDTSSGDLVGIRLTRSAVGGPVNPGKGLLHLGSGEAFAVTVPVG